jgi:Protein of unknown function (DUF1580)
MSILNERYLPLGRAARLLPSLRGERPVHPNTLRRWASRGLRGVRLEVAQCGGTICTSQEALSRFFAALSVVTGCASGSERQMNQEEVDSKLDRLGVRT